jgi:CheY-like chemotaxis protein
MSVTETAASLRDLAEQSNAWPFEEARKIVARLKKRPKDEVIFETGYGPSGLPHIGTFGEVARTTMVRHAFRVLTDDKIKTRLIAFSDDMDGLRKVPDNVPNRDMLALHLGKPLSRVPDPFSNEYPSFGAANNARLRDFLDRFGFEYEFLSSTDCYMSGRFDAALLTVLERFDAIMVSLALPNHDGIRLLMALKRETRIPIVAVIWGRDFFTANYQLRMATLSGADGILIRPFSAARLRVVLSQVATEGGADGSPVARPSFR